MLQQILSDMYIDPELLEELPEEQKQFLFFKMREEQVRRWMIREKELEKEAAKTNGSRAKCDKKSVSFMKGSDGNDWVWVMGDHPNDRTIEQILEEEAEEKALKLAEIEIQKEMAAEKDRRVKEESLRMEREREAERQKLEAERIEAKIRQEELEKEKIRKEEEELKLKKERLKKEAEERERKKKEEEARDNKALEEETKLKSRKLSNADNLNDSPKSRSEDRKTKPEMSGVALRRKSCDEDERLRKMIMRRSREILFDFKSIRARFEENAKKDGKELKRHWRAQELKSKAAEEEIKQASLRVRQAHQKSIRSPINALMAIQLLQAQPSVEPEDPAASDAAPEPAPRKPKPRPLPDSPAPDNDQPLLSPAEKPPVPPRPRVTRRPVNRQAAANWFHRHQKPRGAAVDPDTHRVAPWFHGLITRTQAEAVLEECPQGTFLLRLSERLFGYAVSVRGEHRCKHFLVEAMPPGGYRLFGLGQHPLHCSLHDFVQYHKTTPLSVFGRELLEKPVSQTALTKKEAAEADSSAAFIDLFPEISTEDSVTAL